MVFLIILCSPNRWFSSLWEIRKTDPVLYKACKKIHTQTDHSLRRSCGLWKTMINNLISMMYSHWWHKSLLRFCCELAQTSSAITTYIMARVLFCTVWNSSREQFILYFLVFIHCVETKQKKERNNNNNNKTTDFLALSTASDLSLVTVMNCSRTSLLTISSLPKLIPIKTMFLTYIRMVLLCWFTII